MTALLEIVSEAASMRRECEAEFYRAVRNAADARDARGRRMYTGTEIARAAGLSKQRISQILNREENES